MIVSLLYLNRDDINALRIQDAYSLHRIVYSLFDDIRSDQQKLESISSGFLYVDKGGDWDHRQILILSNRPLNEPKCGKIKSTVLSESFLQHEHYGFEITLNPTKRDTASGKIVPIRGSEAVKEWFISKAPTSWGFEVLSEKLQIQSIGVKSFEKKGHHVTHGSATLIGELIVTDRNKFIQNFQHGIGRGKSFGFGLLQIVPLINHNNREINI